MMERKFYASAKIRKKEIHLNWTMCNERRCDFLCASAVSVAARFSLLCMCFLLHIHFAAGHLHDANNALCLCWMIFPLFGFYASYDAQRKKMSKKVRAHSNQIDGWKLKVIMNICLVLEIWLEMGRLTRYKNTKFPEEEKKTIFFCVRSFAWNYFLHFSRFVLFDGTHSIIDRITTDMTRCSERQRKNLKIKMLLKSWLEFSI